MYARALTVTALSYAVVHHLGLLPAGLGDGPDGTRWADWLDLLGPWLVLVPAAWALQAAAATPRIWWAFGAGALAYTSGHGIHLAANSVGKARPGVTAHTCGTRWSGTTSGTPERRSSLPRSRSRWKGARAHPWSATCLR
jgi:hypothetical protein